MPVVAATVNVHDDKVIREMGDMVLNKIGRPGVVVLAGLLDERVSLQVSVSSELTRRGLRLGLGLVFDYGQGAPAARQQLLVSLVLHGEGIFSHVLLYSSIPGRAVFLLVPRRVSRSPC